MPTVVKEPDSKEFPLAPAGLHNAVCVDVWPIWTEENPEKWGGGLVDKTALVWQLEDSDENGRPFEVVKYFRASLHEKATLRKTLESWRGRAFTQQELRGFDLDTVIGASCQLQLLHHTSLKGKVYANIQGIMPLGKNQPKMVPAPGYVRKKDRAADPGKAARAGGEDFNASDEDIPF